MDLFLRFVIETAASDMAHGHSRDFLGPTREEAGLADDSRYDAYGHPLFEDDRGVWAILPGLAGHALQSETLEDALEEARTTNWPYGHIGQPFAIYEGEYLEHLAFGDGVVFRPLFILFEREP